MNSISLRIDPVVFKTAVLTGLLIAAVAIMILPVPSWLLDIGVAASFSLAILMLVVTLFIEKPLDFSAFPTILLGALVLRLALNVASTKLIIGEGHSGTDAAGNVIEGFALFIMSGNLAIGLVVFCVLLIVNFMVINKGATRMAEVGARFALDAMPGKQLAIDSDIASGALSHEEGSDRRKQEQAEATFFGSLDGTSKFVKGDAIAGLIITLLNLIVGLLIGVFAHSMSIAEGFATYSILTVGDGLVSQIPAVIVSLAAAVLLARGGTDGTTSQAVGQQLSRHPVALFLVGGFLILVGLVPGLPLLPFLGLALILLIAGLIRLMKFSEVAAETTEALVPKDVEKQEIGIPDLLEVEDLQIVFSTRLIPMVLDPRSGLENRIANIRKHVAKEFGVLVPEVHLTDSAEIDECSYVINLMGTQVGRFEINPEAKLAINPSDDVKGYEGLEVLEPVYGAPAKWLDTETAEIATLSGQTVVDPPEIIATHVLNIITENLAQIFNYSALQERLRRMSHTTLSSDQAERNKAFLDALIPEKVPMELLHVSLRELLGEKISIRNIRLIIEAIAEARQSLNTFDGIYAHIRSRLAMQILEKTQDDQRRTNVLQLSEDLDTLFINYTIKNGEQNQIGLPPKIMAQILDLLKSKITELRQRYETLVVACADKHRKFVSDLLRSAQIDVRVLSYSELSSGNAVNVVGIAEFKAQD